MADNRRKILRINLLVSLALGVGLVALGVYTNRPLLILLAGVLLAADILVLRVVSRQQADAGWLNAQFRRIKAGAGRDVLAEALARRERGDRALPNTLVLTAAYVNLGKGEKAELHAREAIAAVEKAGHCTRSTRQDRYWCDLAQVALYDAWLAQGRFSDAAQLLEKHRARALNQPFMALFVAWAYYLAEKRDVARAALGNVSVGISAGTAGAAEGRISALYQPILAYLQRDLLPGVSVPLAPYRDQMPEWEQIAERNAGNPYGARLRPILDAIRQEVEGASGE